MRDKRTAKRHAAIANVLLDRLPPDRELLHGSPPESVHGRASPELLHGSQSELLHGAPPELEPTTETAKSADKDRSDLEVQDPSVIIGNDQIKIYLMREAQAKLKNGLSVSQIEEHLKNAAQLLGGEKIPSKWCDVLKIMESAGYSSPTHYKVCVSPTHSFLLKSKKQHPTCPVCNKSWEDCLDYYCLGLGFRDWFCSKVRCERLMAHWRKKDEWFAKPSDFQPPVLSELWHGQRFRELARFWDSSQEYLLPEKCPHCTSINPAHYLQRFSADSDILCVHCSKAFRYYPSLICTR